MNLRRRFFVHTALSVLATVVITIIAVLLFVSIYTKFNNVDGLLDIQGGFYKIILSFLAFVFVSVFLVSNLIVSRYFTRIVINPLINLKDCVTRIGEGELKNEIVIEGHGEIRELCTSFEHLRLKLRESVMLQEKYDENRKFLISSISHDLKTPVTAIKGYIEGVLDGVADTPEKQEKYLRAAVKKTELVSLMIDDLLFYSKLDLNQIPFRFEKVNLNDYLLDCINDNKYEFRKEEKSISLFNEIEDEATVLIDKERFKRVFQNIITNARNHIQTGKGELIVIVRSTLVSTIIEFKDNGHGISLKDLPYIFDKFYRADSSRKIEGSSGLGLAIAKQIVEGHGGRIWAISNEEEGTSVMISLKKV